jgi:putative cell wall-binding protein
MVAPSGRQAVSVQFGLRWSLSTVVAGAMLFSSVAVPSAASTVAPLPLENVAGTASLAVSPADTAVPTEPLNVGANAFDSSALVTWSPPASPGGTILEYRVKATPGPVTCTTYGFLSCRVTGLTNGTPYTFTVTATNALGTGPASDPSNSVTPIQLVYRYAGGDRFATAAAISANTFSPGVGVVYIATAYNFPDALAGAAAAGTVKGPILLVAPTGAINPATAAELTRLKPPKIIVLGSTGVVSDAVKAALGTYTAVPGNVVRYAGPNRFATAAAISAATFSPGVDVAYIATAYNFPDALAGAAAAGTVKGPVLLVAPTGPLSGATAAELTRLAPKRIVVLGGLSVVGADVWTYLSAFNAPLERIAQADRFGTAAKISAATFPGGGQVGAVYVATAYNFPDALAGAAAAGTVDGPVLLVAPTGPLGSPTISELYRLYPHRIVVLGSTGVVSDAVFDALKLYAVGP